MEIFRKIIMAIRNISRPGQEVQHGDYIEEDLVGGGTFSRYHWSPPEVPEPTSAEDIAERDRQLIEDAREWRDLELVKTDNMAQIPDWPDRDKYIAYRTKLRDWPSTSDFPATRPELG
jgi:hypothetical protein